MKKTITDLLTKRAIVAKLRDASQQLKDFEAKELPDELVVEMQTQLLAVKLGFEMINPETLVDVMLLNKAAKASTPEEIRQHIEISKRVKEKVKDIVPVFKTLMDEFAGVLENKEGMTQVQQDLMRSAGLVLNQLGNAIEQSSKVDLSVIYVLEKQLKNMDKKKFTVVEDEDFGSYTDEDEDEDEGPIVKPRKAAKKNPLN